MTARYLLALLLPGLAGCSDDDASDGAIPGYPYVSSVAVAGCHVPDACDVLAVECQDAWLSTLSCLRDAPAPMDVPMRVIDEATFAEELAADPPEPRATPDHWALALSYLGFLAPDAYQPAALNAELVENVGAYYTYETKSITLIDHGTRNDGISQNATLLHELVHAAQDQDVGIQELRQTFGVDTDSEFGVLGLIEGEAELYQTMVTGALNGIDVNEVDLASVFEERTTFALQEALADPSPYLASYFTLPYAFGGLYTHAAYSVGGAAGVRALYADPPLSGRRLLLKDLENATALEEPELTEVPALLGESFESLFADRFGALGVLLYGGEFALLETLPLVEALRGDRFHVLAHYSETVLVWQLAFADAGSAETFLSLVRPLGAPEQGYFHDGDGQVTIVGCSYYDTFETLLGALGL